MSNMNEQQRIQAYVNQMKQAGASDDYIYERLKKVNNAPQFQSVRASAGDEAMARSLGLMLSAQAEKPTFLVRFGAGMDTTFSGAKQGVLFLKDKVTGGNEYEKFTAEKKAEKEAYEQAKKDSGFSGIDVAEMLGETVALGPLATMGKGYKGVKILSKAGAKVTAQNAGLGALGAMVGFAENSDKRVQNATTGAMLGAGGAIVGKKVGEQISKRVATTAENVDVALNQGLAKMDLKLEDLPDDVAKALRADAKKALKAGKVLDDEAIARRAFLESKGFKPTHAQVTRNATDWTNERELAKLRSTDGILTQKYVDDDTQLRQMLDDEIMATGGKKTDDYVFNQELLATAQAKIQANKAKTRQAYDVAKNADGNDIVLDGMGFVSDVRNQMGKYGGIFLPPELHKLLSKVEKNGLTYAESEDLIKQLNDVYRGTLNNGQPTSHTYTVNQMRQALQRYQEDALQQSLSKHTGQAWNIARQTHKESRQLIDSMPLLKDAERGVEPDKMFSKHIIGGNIGQLRTTMDFLRTENPQLVADIKQSVLEHIAKNAINNTNGFSPAGMKKVLDSLGEPRLKAIFSDDELKRLKDLRMAGELLKQAPIGSNINHSNTASTLANIFGMMIDKVPFASIVKGVRDNINARSQLTGKITMPNVRTVYDDDTVHYATKAGFGLGVANADE